MDSLKARALAFALPAALGLFLSGSAIVESHAADADPFANVPFNNLESHAFSSMAATSSVSFVQRLPAVDDADTEEVQPSVAQKSLAPTMQRLEAIPEIAELHVEEGTSTYGQHTRDFSYTIASPQTAAQIARTERRGDVKALAVRTNLEPINTPSIQSQRIQNAGLAAQSTESTHAPVVSVATDRFNNPVVAGVLQEGRVVSTVEQFGEWDESVCNTPPLHKPVSQLTIKDGEPVIHVIRRTPDDSQKEEFYSRTATREAQDEFGPSPVLDLKPAQDAFAQEQVARAGKMPLRQPADEEPQAPNFMGAQDLVIDQAVTGQASETARRAESSVARSGIPTVSAGEEGKWSPVDMRRMSVDRPLKEEKIPKVSQATAADKAQAKRAVQMGFELVQRRAHYSARARFIQSLRIVARSMDDQTFTTKHTTALRNALAAYEEAVDFYPTSAKPDDDVNLHVILGGHKTPVLSNVDSNRLTPRQCVREYMAYAEQEFVAALGHDGFASQALYGLGRLEASQETASTSAPQVRANRALMLYQTSMLVDPRNYAAANELGVLLAKYGKFETAITAFQHCVMHSPEPTAWTNLANLYHRVGRPAEARMAEMEANNTRVQQRGAPFVANQPRVEWVGPEAFVAMNADTNMQISRSTGVPTQSVQQQVPPPQNSDTATRERTNPKVAGKSTRRSFWPFKKK